MRPRAADCLFRCPSLDANRKKVDGTDDAKQDSSGERRRLSRVCHDDRGNAYVEWLDAPADLVERPRFEIEHDPGKTESSSTGNPYFNGSGAARKTGNGTRTDLRKLSEWIKMMRELEERKRNGGTEE
jgi:hypothetical protein